MIVVASIPHGPGFKRGRAIRLPTWRAPTRRPGGIPHLVAAGPARCEYCYQPLASRSGRYCSMVCSDRRADLLSELSRGELDDGREEA